MMSEMLRSFDEPILDDSGTYHARVIGRLASDGRRNAGVRGARTTHRDGGTARSGAMTSQR